MNSRSSRPRGLGLVLLLLIAACRMPDPGSGRDSDRGEPIALERLQFGSVYGVGSRFESDGLKFTVADFGAVLGNAEIARAPAAPSAKPPRPGQKASKEPADKAIRLAHSTLRCSGPKADRLEFDYSDRGGPVLLAIGETSRTVEDWIELNGQELGGVQLAVQESSTAGVRTGHVVATGPSGSFARFAIGGADLDLSGLRLSRP